MTRQILSALLLLAVVLPVSAHHPTRQEALIPFVLHPDLDSIEVPWSAISGWDTTGIFEIDETFHGVTAFTADGFTYTPNPSFAQVGSDTFIVTRTNGSTVNVAYVAIVSGALHMAEPEHQSFDEPSLPTGWTLSGASIAGGAGDNYLKITPSSSVESFTSFDANLKALNEVSDRGCPKTHAGGSGSSSGGKIRCDDICDTATSGFGGGGLIQPAQTVLILEESPTQRLAEARIRANMTFWEIQVAGYTHLGARVESAWMPMGSPTDWTDIRLELDTWTHGGIGVARVWVEDQLMATTANFQAYDPNRESATNFLKGAHFGAREIEHGGLRIEMNDVEVGVYDLHPRDESLLVEHFNSSLGDSWNIPDSSTAGLNSEIIPGRISAGNQYGMRVDLSQIAVAAWLHDHAPRAETRAVLRFDLAAQNLVEGDHLLVAGLLNSDTISNNAERVRVWVRRHNSTIKLLVNVVQLDGTLNMTDWMPFPSAQGRVEINFDLVKNRATIWIDGQVAGTLNGINALGNIESVRFGAMGAAEESSSLVLDEYQLWVQHELFACAPDHDHVN